MATATLYTEARREDWLRSARFYEDGEAEAKLDELYAARNRAMTAGDATAWNCIDREIRTVLAVMRDEVRLGLRDDPIFTTREAA